MTVRLNPIHSYHVGLSSLRSVDDWIRFVKLKTQLTFTAKYFPDVSADKAMRF